MGIRTTTHQKASPFQIRRDRLAHQFGGLPAGPHGVVVPDFGPVEAQVGRRRDQALVGQAVAGRVGQQRQTPGGLDRRHHRLSPQGRTHHRGALQVGMEGGVLLCEAQTQDVDQTSLQQAADLHAAPEGGSRLTPPPVGLEGGGLVEVQGTAEHGTFDRQKLDAMLDAGTASIAKLIEMQKHVLG